MRLFEAILDANHRAVAGDSRAGVHVADFADELPVVALTCIDARLNRFFPGVLGLPDEYFIWLRNAGNIITSPVSSTMRSLALACAVKGGREIAIIGHTDCKIPHTTISQLIDLFKALGIERQKLPENLTEYFGVFASEQQNVLRSVDFVRRSPLIGPAIPVHGLMVATDTGNLDWIVNGYEALGRPVAQPPPALQMPSIGAMAGELMSRAGAELSGLKVPDVKIGEAATRASQWMSEIKIAPAPAAPPSSPSSPRPAPSPPMRPPQPIPIPPRIEPPPKPGGSRYRP
ncbi:MAG: carbonic anhydrase [Verrucomicrobiota bacterium]|jgi:carbonic anhydrase